MQSITSHFGSRPFSAVAAAFALGSLAASPAVANTVSSNDPNCSGAPIDRVFTVTAVSVVNCLAKGTGNINGNGDAINALGYLTLDKSDDNTTGLLEGSLSLTGSGTTSGTFSISPQTYTLYEQIVIAFKSGEGQVDPDWAAFLLADNTLSGVWSISQQALSHANLYGKERSTVIQQTPEPASLALVGAALIGLFASRRRNS